MFLRAPVPGEASFWSHRVDNCECLRNVSPGYLGDRVPGGEVHASGLGEEGEAGGPNLEQVEGTGGARVG